jgi:nitroreductase
MDVIEAIKERYSVRSYADRDVSMDDIMELIEAARLAPSASNRQEWRFIVVRNAVARKQLADAARNQKFVREAPIVLVCCAETDGHIMSCGQACYPIDVAIAIDHITLRATELGLGSCWVGAFDAERVKEILDIPERIKVVELLPIGYPADKPREKRRLPLEMIVKLDRW